MRIYILSTLVRISATLCAAALATLALAGCTNQAKPEGPRLAAPTDDKVELSDDQLKTISIAPVGEHTFSPQRVAVGSIDFDEDRAVQVFSNYPGKIVQAYVQIGDEVAKGQPLYTIESPDLLNAGQTLISAAGVYDLTTKELARAKALHATKGIADKDFEQAVSDQMTADANLRAARAAMKVFGKTDADIDQMIARRYVDPVLVVRSPISGRVTARNAQPGLLVQPGNTPAPYQVADLSTMWMLANVAETDVPLFHRGLPVRVKVMAFPDRDFTGTISVIGATVDPATHTETVRSEVADPNHELRPGMFATFVVTTGQPVTAVAVPLDAVVRNGDGTMNVWVTTDHRHFVRRTVKIGLQQDSFDQILDGLQSGEQIVTKDAVFLSNMANAESSDD